MLMVVLDGMLKGLMLIVGQMLRDVPVNAHDDRSIRLRSMAAIEVANSLFSLFSLYGSLTSQELPKNMNTTCPCSVCACMFLATSLGELNWHMAQVCEKDPKAVGPRVFGNFGFWG